jgi:dienelactone hydrolase
LGLTDPALLNIKEALNSSKAAVGNLTAQSGFRASRVRRSSSTQERVRNQSLLDPANEAYRRRRDPSGSGAESKIIVYPDASHRFFADYRPEYKGAAAEASWSEATGWLKEHGV